MEQKFYTDNFEQLLKEKADEFRMYPSKRVWHSIYNDLHPGRKWPSVAVSLLLISTLLFIGYWNSNPSVAVSKNTVAQADKNIAQLFSSSDNALAAGGKSGMSVTDDNPLAPAYSNINKAGTKDLPVQNPPGYAATGTTNNRNQRSTTTPANYSNRNASRLQKPVRSSGTNAPVYSGTAATPVTTGDLSASINEGNAQTTEAVAEVTMIEENTTASLPLPGTGNTNNIITPTGVAPEKIMDVAKENKPVVVTAAKNTTTTEDKSWMEDYAFHNKPSSRNRWKGRIASEIYFTPSIGYRKFTSNTDYSAPVASSFPAVIPSNGTANTSLMHKAGLGFEIGAGAVFSAAKNLRIKAGVQANFTSYNITATEINHPVLTTLLMNDINTGFTYLDPRASSIANTAGYKTTQIHNQTYQFSIPVGVALKLAGHNKLEWYAGAAIQPTYVFGGKANLISADHKNYIADASLIRSWNLNTGFETYIHYKMNGYTLQVGPQFRYQVMSTYSKKYTYNENLYNTGIKIGLVKNF